MNYNFGRGTGKLKGTKRLETARGREWIDKTIFASSELMCPLVRAGLPLDCMSSYYDENMLAALLLNAYLATNCGRVKGAAALAPTRIAVDKAILPSGEQ